MLGEENIRSNFSFLYTGLPQNTVMVSKRMTTKHASWSNIPVMPSTHKRFAVRIFFSLPDSVFCKQAINSPQLRLYCCYMRVRRTANLNTNFLLRQNVGLGKGY